MKKLLWLDDVRNPLENDWLNFSPIGKDVEVIWVKSYNEFINWLNNNEIPDGVCFDHDLDDIGMTGYDACKYLCDYCLDNNKPLPLYNIQSANPVGRENIDYYMRNFKKHNY